MRESFGGPRYTFGSWENNEATRRALEDMREAEDMRKFVKISLGTIVVGGFFGIATIKYWPEISD